MWNRHRVLAVAVLVILAISPLACTRQEESSGPSIPYQGENFRLTKEYSDYDEYKNDPNNIDPSERERVAASVLQASIGSSYATWLEMGQAVQALAFPGYGVMSLGESTQTDGSSLCCHAIEIPFANRERYLVFRKLENRYYLIEDFTLPSESLVRSVKMEGSDLVYELSDGSPLKRPLPKK